MKRFPKACRQRYPNSNRQDQLYITLPQEDGSKKRVYLGQWSDPAAHQQYNRLRRDWEAGKAIDLAHPVAGSAPAKITVAELFELYILANSHLWAQQPDGHSPNRQKYKSALISLGDFAYTSAAGWTGKTLRRWQAEKESEQRLARTTINAYTSAIKCVFAWGALNDYIPDTTNALITAVKPLQKGKSNAKETAPRSVVKLAVVKATLEHLAYTPRTIIELLIQTGARPGEICGMSMAEIEKTKKGVWLYRPTHHKNKKKGLDRIIVLGKRAQDILTAYIKKEKIKSGYIFRDKKRPKSPCYLSDALEEEIRVVCQREGIEKWSPYRIRHTIATRVAKTYGMDVAQLLLGHTSTATTSRYVHPDTTTIISMARMVYGGGLGGKRKGKG